MADYRFKDQIAHPRDVQRLTGVHPTLATIIYSILKKLPMFVVEGVRTAERQHSLYLLGRGHDPGPRVTDKDGYVNKSRHQVHPDGLGYAVDCAFKGTDPFALSHDWHAYGALLEASGCLWGGRWKGLVDRPHAELPVHTHDTHRTV